MVKLAHTMKRATNASMAYIPCCSIVLMCYNLEIESITTYPPDFRGIETGKKINNKTMKTNYYQVVDMTKEEKIAMYMKCTKKQIAEMLINCNDIITALTQAKNCVIPAVMGELTCDSCGCHPNTIYTTSKGRFCERCKPAS